MIKIILGFPSERKRHAEESFGIKIHESVSLIADAEAVNEKLREAQINCLLGAGFETAFYDGDHIAASRGQERHLYFPFEFSVHQVQGRNLYGVEISYHFIDFPKIKKLADLSEEAKLRLASVKERIEAVLLQFAGAKFTIYERGSNIYNADIPK